MTSVIAIHMQIWAGDIYCVMNALLIHDVGNAAGGGMEGRKVMNGILLWGGNILCFWPLKLLWVCENTSEQAHCILDMKYTRFV